MSLANQSLFPKIITILRKKQVIFAVYILLAIIASSKQYLHHSYNNYLIFKYVYWHTVDLQNLYSNYAAYNDSNHYGIVFSLLIAPFALLPDGLAMFLWNIVNVLVLLWGIYSLPISLHKRTIVAWICAHETLTALFSFQFNIALTGLMLLSFSYLIKKEEIKSAFFIALGTLIKLYGIVGLAFFFFTRQKLRFILAGLGAFLILFLLPMTISSPSFVIQSYADWYQSLVHKNTANASLTSFQDISIMGMCRRISGNINIPNGPFLLSGLVLFALPYFRIKQYKYLAFRLMLLASTLIFTVIFSSGSESPTYIIAFAGVAIWFIVQQDPKRTWIIALFIFAFVLTSLSPTDILPRAVKDFIRLYSLKALPCVIIWITIVYQMLKENFESYPMTEE
ncbi:glycosyltransferase family 87 protein [Pedobacter sp. CFBP9032]|uniref:glycosyltransferase family 87 protein n=1 Tax=Pedobacter sp. CFBP9032 TaxID=3096539 RepID=UPI002A6AAEF5|nr:glycosyltransferase family 87 protein [Pedobacter sp. CFBP9032]MDY0906870.1 glycosyltransferase family 87 protein [Pedobacter sp. CFBP9032]